MTASRTSDKQARLGRSPRTRLKQLERPGVPLNALVLARYRDQWIAVDLDSWAFVRAVIDPAANEPTEEPSLFEPASFEVIGRLDPIDPARPEALWTQRPRRLGRTPSRRKVTRLLRTIAVHERQGAVLLGSRGPSLAYPEIDASAPSIELVALRKHSLQLADRDGETRLAIRFAGSAQRFVVGGTLLALLEGLRSARDLEEALRGALGYQPAFALIGLGEITDGHVPKALLALLPAGVRRKRRLALPES